MKKLALLPLCLLSLVATMFAQNTATVAFTNQSAFNVAAGNTFNVTFSLQTGTNLTVVSGFDLFLQSNSPNVNNNFSITAASYVAPGTNPGTPTYPDTISTSSSDQPGFAMNNSDQGRFFAADRSVPTDLVTLTLQIGVGTPAGSYTFMNSPSTGGGKETLIFGGPSTNDDLNAFSVNQASFTVTVAPAAVPEPATWSLMALSGLGTFGLSILRRTRRS